MVDPGPAVASFLHEYLGSDDRRDAQHVAGGPIPPRSTTPSNSSLSVEPKTHVLCSPAFTDYATHPVLRAVLPMTNRQLAVLLGLGCVWGASFLFIKVVVDAGVAPLGVSASRSTLGALTLVPVAITLRHQFPKTRGLWAMLAMLGALNFALPWTLFAAAEQHAPSSAAVITNSSQPLWAAIFATFLLKTERLSGGRIIGLLMGFAGVLVIMGGGLLHGGAATGLAVLVMLGATLCYGLSAVIIRRWMRSVPALPLAIGQIGFCALYLFPAALLFGDVPGPSIGTGAVLSLVVLGGVNSGIMVVGYMWLIHQVGPVRAAVVTYLMPPIGVALGFLVLHEQVGWSLAAGLVLVVLGVAVVQQAPVGALLGRLSARNPVRGVAISDEP